MNDDFADLRDSFFSDDDESKEGRNDASFENDALFDETLFNDSSDLVDDLPSFDDADAFAGESDSLDDEFDQLRRKSARGETMHGGLESDEMFASAAEPSRSRFSMRNFSPIQRFIIALLVVLDLGMILLGVLVVAGIVG